LTRGAQMSGKLTVSNSRAREKRARGPAGKGPVFLAFREVAELPTAAERKAALLDRLDHIWELALGRSYTKKDGSVVPNPDLAIADKVVVTASELVGVREGEGGARRPIDLSLFNGGKAAEKKAAG